MKITDVRFLALRYPLAEPLRLAWGPMTHRNFGLVLIETDAGLTGLGETSVNYPAWAPVERRATIEEGIRPLLIGEDPLRIEHLWAKMHAALFRLGLVWGKGPITSAIGGVDIALWDLAGKARNLPVYELLGGLHQARIPLYATGLDPKDLVGGARAQVDAGHRAVKLRVGFEARWDIANVEAVRQAVGDEVDVLVDANMGWDRHEARRMVERLRPYNLYWLEEPLRADDVAGLAELARATDVPLAAGENAFDRRDALALLEAGAIQFIMPDPTRAGGLTECRKICALAEAHGVRYSPHHYGSDVGFAAALHLMAATPGGGYLLRDVSPVPLREAVLTKPIVIADGHAQVPTGPGLGIALDPEAVAHYRLGGDTRS